MVAAARTANRKSASAQLDFISREEGRAILDEQARRVLRMSGEEFAAQWAAGGIPDPDRPAVISIAMLLPLAR